jgi:hypothetical protein
MFQVMQARCPRCGKVLRFPSEWSQATLRCKECRVLLQSRSRVMVPANGSQIAADPLSEQIPAFGTANGSASSGDLHLGHHVNGASGATANYLRRRRADWKKRVVTFVFLGVVGGLIFAKWDRIVAEMEHAGMLKRDGAATASTEPDNTNKTSREDSATTNDRATAGTTPSAEKAVGPPPFPRRILAISIGNYLFANPLNNGAVNGDIEAINPKPGLPESGFHKVLNQLADSLHVPSSQVVELSDTAPRPLAKPPLKSVIETTVNDFLDSCRAQDRIILMFVGHALEIGDECYLVPIEGELGAKETLIPLNWLYDALARCKAQQKVLIMDVCRFNPSRGLERPGTGPMGLKLDAMLNNPPAGVQVWTACVAGQYSYEGAITLPDRKVGTGGYFMSELAEAVGNFNKRVNTGIQQPSDPLPLEVLAQGDGKAKGVNAGTEQEVKEWYKAQQTPRLAGKPADSTIAFEPAEPLPAPVAIKLPVLPEGQDMASRSLVQHILHETDAESTRDGSLPLRFEGLPIFDAKKLEAYVDDGKQTDFRKEITRTATMLRRHTKTFTEVFRHKAGESIDNGVKAFFLEQQKGPARAFAELMGQLETLKEIGEQEKANEKSKRWRANYDFVLAKLLSRLAYVHEYNYMLGQIRKDNLPPIDPAKHAGWRLAAQEKMNSGSEAKKMATEAKSLLTKLAKQHQGTPWEIIAKRQALTSLGLTWQPAPRDTIGD